MIRSFEKLSVVFRKMREGFLSKKAFLKCVRNEGVNGKSRVVVEGR
jgi:hypothetical protein